MNFAVEPIYAGRARAGGHHHHGWHWGGSHPATSQGLATSLLSASLAKVLKIFSDERGDLRKRLELSGSSSAACRG